MVAVLLLRRKEPGLLRPFRVPMYPVFPITALVIAIISMIAMITLNVKLAIIFFAILALAYIWFHFIYMTVRFSKCYLGLVARYQLILPYVNK